jgi:hypothetical protein
VTVERQGLTLLVGSATEIFDVCPLCGNKLAPERAEQAVTGLQKSSQVPTSATEERGKQSG